MSTYRRHTIWVLTLALFCVPTSSIAQESMIDTSRVYELDMVVKTANRTATILANTTSATSVITAGSLRRSPALTVTDHLSRTPGIAFFSLDGLGFEPQPTVRGFYGGGEAEYVQLQLDGQPLSDGESGLVNWFTVPLTGVQSIEILRGGSSAFYGDAAVGAVINLITPAPSNDRSVLSIRSGSSVPFETSFRHTGILSGSHYSVYGGYTTVDGFRDHAERDLGSIGARLQVREGERSRITLNTEHHWNYGDVPGPTLLGEKDREASLPFFRYDRGEESIHRLGGRGDFAIGELSQLEISLSSQLRNLDVIETIPLSTGFADTQQRKITDIGVRIGGQLDVTSSNGGSRLIGGIELSTEWLDSRYLSILSGTEADYVTGPQSPQPVEASTGDGARRRAAAFAHYDVSLGSRVRLTAGARLDVLEDDFRPSGSESTTVSHTAISPKVGLNYRVRSTVTSVTNVYANVARSFKAPTFDQLFDQRTIPVPFPPFSVSLSSAELDPQYGTSLEAGAYHRFETDMLSGELSLTLYQIDMQDEIDFDLQALTYRNLGKSRHRGIETDATIYAGAATLRGSYAYQETTLRFGEFDGNFVKAIPRDIVSAGVDLPVGPIIGSATLRSARRIYLDDANTRRLPSYTTVDTRLGYDFGRAVINVEVFNLLDATFSTTGFPDPGGSEAIFVFPFTGRHFRLGATVQLP